MGFNIAIDGPAGAGKSTIAKLVAARQNCIYVDTGAMYRGLAVHFLGKQIDPSDITAVIDACRDADVSIRYEDGMQQVYLNGTNITGQLRSEEVGDMASKTSAIPEVRTKLLELQRTMAREHDVVMDGRDIGTQVLPDATVKIYLTASAKERAKRRYLELKEKGAANINLVTGAHYVPQIIEALDMARRKGLDIPVVYNSSGYEKTETLKLLEGYVDIYLPDYKYAESELAVKFSHANDYPERAMEAVNEMVRQTGMPQFDAEGYMKRGTIVRHLILPGHTRNSKKVLKLLHKTFGKQIYISIMNQYTPVFEQKEYTELNRCVTRREYEKVLDYAFELGIENGFFQDGETARESFIPAFDYEGVRKMP